MIRQGIVAGFAEPLKNEIEIISIVIPQNDVAGDPDKSGGGSGAFQSLSEHGSSNIMSGDVNATQGVAEVSDPGPLGVENKDRVVDSLPDLGERAMVNLEDEYIDKLQGDLSKANVAHDNKGLTPASSDSHENRIPPCLRELYDKSICGKFDEQKAVIESLLVQYQDMFSKDETDLGRTHLIEHEIDTGNARSIKQPPRRFPMALAHEEAEAIQNLESQGVIRESNSPWASPIVLVRKKNGKIRPCVDYRQVNLLTRKDAYHIPRTKECLDTMAGSVIFSTLDMTPGYNQVPIKTTDIPKTAFVARKGLLEIVTMSFGLTNAPATFQRLMELICRGFQWTSCLIYLDDILVFGKSFQKHTERFQDVLERIRLSGLKLKPEKCELFHEEVRFLGHIINAQWAQPDPMNIS